MPLFAKLLAISLVWSLGLSIICDRVVAPTKAGPFWSLLGGFIVAMATATAAFVLMHAK